MISAFQGQSADNVWQQAAEAFRRSDGARSQNSRGGPTREILHVAISIADPRQRWVVSREPPLNIAFALAEVVWIMTGRRDLAFLEYWNSRYRDFVGPGPELHGAYGYRLRSHLGIDQLKRAFQVLVHDPDTRQVVLQIWDSRIDLPAPDGTPANRDVPCNVAAMPKLRDGKLEWLQVIRSNDMFLGVPHNFVQFTSMQEILAGWLGVECGSYTQISDSLHVYDSRWEDVMASTALPRVSPNHDRLALPRQESDRAFRELERRVEQMIDPETDTDTLEGLASWDSAPQSYRNIAAVLTAEALRRRRLTESAARIMSRCTNLVYQQLWSRWCLSRQKQISGTSDSPNQAS